MAYYLQGDYYRGAMGDPGIFGSIGKFLGGAVKTVAGAAGGFLAGGPIGAIGGALKGAGVLPSAPRASLPGPVLTMGGTQFAPLAAAPGGAPLFSSPSSSAAMVGAGCPPGYHLNKGRYYSAKRGGVVEPGSVCVKNRRMNSANVRALRRGIRREASFIKIARRTGLVQLPRASRTRKKARS